MRKSSLVPILFLAVIAATGCASSGVDLDESERLMGRERDVRIDAQITSSELASNSNLGLKYEIENLRAEPIAVADIVPEVSYDTETGVITVLLGSEVPGNEFLPRLEMIRSGERRTFSAGANLNVGGAMRKQPRAIRIRLSYLENVEPFSFLVDISEKAVRDPEKADALFLTWVDNVKSVTTNEVPLNWSRRSADEASTARPPRRPPGSRF